MACRKKQMGTITILCWLSIFAKFLGDGVLFIWDTQKMDTTSEIGNVIITMNDICSDYVNGFIPLINSNLQIFRRN